jgi:hypothetical protein
VTHTHHPAHSASLQGLAKVEQGADSSGNGGGGGGGAAATTQLQAAGRRQDFPEKRKAIFCYKAPSDSLLIQVWTRG